MSCLDCSKGGEGGGSLSHIPHQATWVSSVPRESALGILAGISVPSWHVLICLLPLGKLNPARKPSTQSPCYGVPPNSYVERLTLKGMVLGGGAFGR